ncbi:MAG: hypothetical protein HY823_12050 [Acidobacteria bacterium]|nr:hypothetical protein [Acidobacteriota bacterium]
MNTPGLAALFAFCLPLGPLQAQSRFDAASFQPPADWKAAREGDHLGFTHIDRTAGTYCMLVLYESRPGGGDGTQDFAREWRDIVQATYRGGPTPRPVRGNTPGGLAYLEGSGTGAFSGGDLLARLRVFSFGNRVFSVLMLAPSSQALAARQAALSAFFGSLRLGSPGPVPASPQAPPASSGREGPWKGGGISGVWMGFKYLPASGSHEPQPRWYLFYDDGQVFKDLPRNGPAGFDRAAAQADPNLQPYWATYRVSGRSGEILSEGSRFTTRLEVDRADSMLVDGERFHRCAPVNGLRLEGAWSTYAAGDTTVLQRPAGQRPLFRFTRDGRFSDEGVFRSYLTFFGGDDSPGQGTYEIRDFTLFLRYADGRQKQVAFSGMLGSSPGSENGILWIGRGAFHRMK